MAPRLLNTTAPASTVLIRAIVGGIFLAEGVMKFLYPDALGAGRFAKIGIPYPEVMGPFVGCVEIIGGLLLLIGLFTRIAAAVTLVNMLVAIVSTKGPVLVGHAFAGFSLQKVDRYGFLSFMHEARTDLLMIFGLLFLLVAGAGSWSMDVRLTGSAPAASTKREGE